MANKILGIDPGLRVTGYGIIYNSSGSIRYETSGVIKTTNQDTNLAPRIKIILLGLEEIINQFKPDCVAIEKVFVNKNPQSTLLLGQARGAAISAAVMQNLDVYEYTALQVKKSVVGMGHASKSQVQIMVQKLLKLPSIPTEDSADALACAICHANISGSLAKFGTGNRMKSGRII
ncbi:crossover junction endodeoxyribonuclease RuvC [Methylophilaceae bacterium]|nr:crossover junction endodeoxyribonuclease RuvC [Methylophilaceae bacterium]